MKFTEDKLGKAFVELLAQEGFPHHLGIDISWPADEGLIEEDLLNLLLSKYENQRLTITEAKSIILQLKALPASDLYETNKTITMQCCQGWKMMLKRWRRRCLDIWGRWGWYGGEENV
jgi:type I restriction enzyme R subunit